MCIRDRVINDVEIQKYIVDIKKDKTSMYYGYRKVTYVLRRKYNLKINKKKVKRLMGTLNLLGDNRKNKKKYISRTCESKNVTGSNQLWQMDIKYAFIAGTKQTAYITSIIAVSYTHLDVYKRQIIAIDNIIKAPIKNHFTKHNSFRTSYNKYILS